MRQDAREKLGQDIARTLLVLAVGKLDEDTVFLNFGVLGHGDVWGADAAHGAVDYLATSQGFGFAQL